MGEATDAPTAAGGPRGVEFIRPPRANDRQAADQRPRSNEFDPTGKATEPKVINDFKLRKVGSFDLSRPSHRHAFDPGPRSNELALFALSVESVFSSAGKA